MKNEVVFKRCFWGGLVGLAQLLAVAAESTAAHGMALPAKGSYAVVVSSSTYGEVAWRWVADTLCAKYAGRLIIHADNAPEEALPELRDYFPNYACFVTPAEGCSREFVVRVSRLTRQLDDDPYGDLLWGIMTGYEAADAMRAVALERPLTILRGATSMGPGLLERLESGFASDEYNPTNFWVKSDTATGITHSQVAPDASRALAEAFASMPVDMFLTSGHATERDWQIAYNLPGGAFRHADGQLFAESIKGVRVPFNSPNPKVYLPIGNCLMGHIDKRDCMATAWMHSGGVAQMLGYTVVTFFGYMGWGTDMLFRDSRLTLSEAFFLNSQALVHELAQRSPELLKVMPEMASINDLKLFRKNHGLSDGYLFGLLWDRDTVAFYGDPAWAARFAVQEAATSVTIEESGGHWRVVVKVLTDGNWSDPKWGSRPVAVLLPERISDISGVTRQPEGRAPLVTDRFVLLPVEGKRKVGEEMSVRFTARRVKERLP